MCNNAVHSFKIVLVGDAKVGKTTFLARLATGQFFPEYAPTQHTRVRPLVFNTNKGRVCFEVWDQGSRDGLNLDGVAGAIVMFDLTRFWFSLARAGELISDVRDAGDIPVVLAGNKTDVLRESEPCQLGKQHELRQFREAHRVIAFTVSAKSNTTLKSPSCRWPASCSEKTPTLCRCLLEFGAVSSPRERKIVCPAVMSPTGIITTQTAATAAVFPLSYSRGNC